MHLSQIKRTVACAVTTALAAVLFPAGTATAVTASAATLFSQLTVEQEVTTGYSRDLFGDWIDADGDGCDTRSEVLQVESTVAVTYSSGCTVATGMWVSPYDGVTSTNASDVVVDHTVPTAEAWRSGAHAWTAEQRTAYANDLDFAPSLQTMTDELDQSKGDREPAQWLPPLAETHCQYAVEWVSIKWRWSLTIDDAEAYYLGWLLSDECGATAVTVDRAITSVTPPAPIDRLTAGTTLVGVEQIVAEGGGYRLVMQGDGNAVVYSAAGDVLWASGTNGNPGAYLVLQNDGNLVIYSSTGQPLVWNDQRGAGSSLVMQSDGNLVQYRSDGRPMWWTKVATPTASPAPSGGQVAAGQTLAPSQSITSTGGQYRLVMQTDGNLVAYAATGRVQWASNTSGNPGARLVMQSDGNAVVYSVSGRVLWHAAANGRGGDRLVIQDDGNLVIYTAAGRPIWNTGPYRAPVAPPPAPRPASPDLDCPDFVTQAEAQVTLDHWKARGLGDVHGLDGDDDGIACDSHFG